MELGMQLAAQLRTSAEQWRAYKGRQEQVRRLDDIQNARRIAERMIRGDLPDFLSDLAQKGRHRAYLVGSAVYEPGQWNPDLPRCTDLPLSWCCAKLVGVPLHLARWAIGQGFKVYLQNHHNFPKDEHFSWNGRRPQNNTEGSTGLCVRW